MKIENIDPEDFEDIILKIEKSFNINFQRDAFKEATTFGHFCDVIERQISFDHIDDCTLQQAFNKIRKSICDTQTTRKEHIYLDAKLADLFPRIHRRKAVGIFETELGFDVGLMTIRSWLETLIITSFAVSLLLFFVSWQAAICGLLLSVLITWLAAKFPTEIKPITVRQLTEKISRDHYQQVRRNPGTVNKKEIRHIIEKIFIEDEGIDKDYVTRDASLGWI